MSFKAGALLGFGLGGLYTKWRGEISIRNNFQGLIADRVEAFPSQPVSYHHEKVILKGDFHEAAKRNDAVLKQCRTTWRRVEYLSPIKAQQLGVTITEVYFPSRDYGRKIRALVFVPTVTGKKTTLPVSIYVHGGGFVCGSPEAYSPTCSAIAAATHCVIVSVDYRLAPEHVFPSGLNDCEDLLNWVASSPESLVKLGGDPGTKGLALIGDSAGGNLVAVLGLFAKEKKIELVAQVLIYPITTACGLPMWRDSYLPRATDSMVRNSRYPVLSSANIVWFSDMYLSNPQNEAFDVRVSPILNTREVLKDSPKTLCLVAKFDVLYDDGVQYAKKLEATGVDVKLHSFDEFHGFISFDTTVSFQPAISLIAEFLKPAFGQRSTAKL